MAMVGGFGTHFQHQGTFRIVRRLKMRRFTCLNGTLSVRAGIRVVRRALFLEPDGGRRGRNRDMGEDERALNGGQPRSLKDICGAKPGVLGFWTIRRIAFGHLRNGRI
jgi:hypothetical protein